jgi:hypothetical protein
MLGNQSGSSVFGTTLILAIVCYGIFVGIQYFPQYIESSTVDSVLDSIRSNEQTSPAGSAQAVRNQIDNLLSLNSMQDLEDSFKVTQNGDSFTIDVSYERELNLIFTKKKLLYEKSLTLQ